MQWELIEDGIEAARNLEQIAIPFGLHIALGGSVLHKRMSDKDIDIFVYPHKDQCVDVYHKFIGHLISLGYILKNAETEYKAVKELVIMEYQGKRYDFFFLK
jgi:hypothetical protein